MTAAGHDRASGSPSAAELHDDLFVGLRNTLGEGYLVGGPREFAHWLGRHPDGPQADIAVRDEASGRVALIEVKGSTKAELPLSAASHALAIKQAYEDVDPPVVLVSLSPVNAPVRGVLEKNGVELVEGGDPEAALALLTRLIRLWNPAAPEKGSAAASAADLAATSAARPGQEVNNLSRAVGGALGDTSGDNPAEAGGAVVLDVEAPVEEVYDYWRNLENLPSFMKNIEEVRVTGPDTTHWVVKGPLGYRAEFDARTTQNEPNSAIGWNSLSGDLRTSGQVRFREVGPSRTRLEVEVRYADVPAGALGEAASRLTFDPKAVMEQDLRNFRDIIEGRTTPEEVWWRTETSERERGIGPDRTDAERPPWERPGPLLAGGALLAWLLLRDGRPGGEDATEDRDGRLALLLAGGASLAYLALRRPREGQGPGGGRLSGVWIEAARRAQNLEENLLEIFESIEYMGRDSDAADEARRRAPEKV